MWLLNTNTGALRHFQSPEDVPGGYAILSHVWGRPEEEDTFQSVQAAAKTCEEDASLSRTQNASSAGPETSNVMDAVIELQIMVRRQEAILSAVLARLDQLESKSRNHANSPEFNNIPVALDPHALLSGPVATSSYETYTAPVLRTPRDHLSPKIQSFLKHAEEQGYEWAWSDTCCIDKTSSTELTEAINSMFRYYSLSVVCYAYLSDVSVPNGWTYQSDRFPYTLNYSFKNSTWHKRGWTLQELLAPDNVVFMSNDWTFLGTKYTLAVKLEAATGIPTSILRLEEDFATMNIATRMSWAATRETTRIEDEAYCLLGIFGVNMPTIYGEGRKAFYRLQKEILGGPVDSTFLVWQDSLGYLEDCVWASDTEGLTRTANDSGGPQGHALAQSPKQFHHIGPTATIRTGHYATSTQVGLFSVNCCANGY